MVMIDGVTLRGRFAGSASETLAGVSSEAASSRAIDPRTPAFPRSPKCGRCEIFRRKSLSRVETTRTSRCRVVSTGGSTGHPDRWKRAFTFNIRFQKNIFRGHASTLAVMIGLIAVK
jgi:hypothetical protein